MSFKLVDDRELSGQPLKKFKDLTAKEDAEEQKNSELAKFRREQARLKRQIEKRTAATEQEIIVGKQKTLIEVKGGYE